MWDTCILSSGKSTGLFQILGDAEVREKISLSVEGVMNSNRFTVFTKQKMSDVIYLFCKYWKCHAN